MATIKRYPFARHLRTAPTSHVLHLHAGRLRHDGAGLAFWFRPLSAVISEIPVDDRELPSWRTPAPPTSRTWRSR